MKFSILLEHHKTILNYNWNN